MSKEIRKMTTTEVAEELGLDRAKFVKSRARYEKKLIDNGFTFTKEGTQRTLVYLFETNRPLSIDSPKEKIIKIFQIDPQNRIELMNKYLFYIAENPQLYITQTDLEVAKVLGDHRTNITKVRNILRSAGYVTLGEEHYFKEKNGEFFEVTREEWNEVWRTYYYPQKELINEYKPTGKIGHSEFTIDAHLSASQHMRQQTGYQYTKKKERVLTFEFLHKLAQYTDRENLFEELYPAEQKGGTANLSASSTKLIRTLDESSTK